MLMLVVCILSFLPMIYGAAKNKYLQTQSGDDKHNTLLGIKEAEVWLKEIDEKLGYMNNEDSKAQWNYTSNITDYNNEIMVNSSIMVGALKKEIWQNISQFNWKKFQDVKIYRQFKKLSNILEYVLPEDKLKEFQNIVSDMQTAYSITKVCSEEETKPNCSLRLEPNLTNILSKSRDYKELLYVWKEWHDSVGPEVKKSFPKYVKLSNEAAHLLSFPNMGDAWRDEFENETFEEIIENLFKQMLPLYENLHAYMRRKLIQIYGEENVDPNGPIPAHLLGNMWAQTWENLYNDTLPFPHKQIMDVTSELIKQNYSRLKMFKTAENFFKSLGFLPMTKSFWKNSIIEKPDDREIICHASAWDFFDGEDFRIKMCTDITNNDLVTIHHEMGHIQYYMQYRNQPQILRDGANSGFHEAIGDTIALSAGTPSHLHKIGLLGDVEHDKESDLNFLYLMALEKVAFLPFGYLIDQWRWKVFSGEISPKEYNKKWWELRFKYQGIAPAVARTEEHFDPGAKYHIAANVPYVRYFISFITQFSFHKALCQAAGFEGPLHLCDIYESKKAGKLLSDVLKLGASEPWPVAMKKITGKPEIDASAIMEYFDPLLKWLQKQNKNEKLGWGYNWNSENDGDKQKEKPSKYSSS